MRVSEMGAWLGGTVVDLAAEGNTVLAATFAGIYRSTDRGKSWHVMGKELPDWFIQAVALAPMDAATLAVAASHGGWVYRSVDGGESWEVVSSESHGVVTRLVASPNFARDGLLFACTEADGIFKSVDRGRTWGSANFGLLNLSVLALCFSPAFAEDEVVFAGTDGGGIFRSRNGGRAWRESGEGMPDSAVQCIAVSPNYARDGVVLAGTEDQGLYRSDDKGRTWHPVSSGEGEGQLAEDACINDLYLSADWAEGGTMIAATDVGFLLSGDGGVTWQGVQHGPDFPYVIDWCEDKFLAGAYEGGVYGSVDGRAWRKSNAGLAAHLPPVACLSEAFERDRTVVMASMEATGARSVNGGQTWQPLQIGEDELPVSLLAGAGRGADMALLAAGEGNLFASHDGGRNWARVGSVGEDMVSAVAVGAPLKAGRLHLLVAGTMGGQLLFSPDGGASWAQRASFTGSMVAAVAVQAGEQGEQLYVAVGRQMEGGDWRLTLYSGDGWNALVSREVREPIAVLDLQQDGELYCALGRHVLCLQEDQVVAEGEMEDALPVSSLRVHGEMLLAGTRSGLYRSGDKGASWEPIAPEVQAVALRFASPAKAYAASMGGRLWEIDLA